MTATAEVFARPFEFDPVRWSTLLDKLCAHRLWFDDDVWADPAIRRATAASRITYALTHNGAVFEVWHGAEVTGVIFFDHLNLGRDAFAHFVFFDQLLANKQMLCLNVAKWAFETHQLEAIRIEVPTYADLLARWARKKLGFRYEMEGRQPSWPKKATPLDERFAMLGSRRHRAVKYDGKWHDVLLLSLMREEFFDFYGQLLSTERRTLEREQRGSAATDGTGDGRTESVPERPVERESVLRDESAAAADG